MTSDAFVGLLHEEWRIHQTRRRNGNEESFNLVGNQRKNTNLVTGQRTPGPAKSLESQISDHKKDVQPYCTYCKKSGHWMRLCRKMLNNKCYNCSKLGHMARDCRKPKKERKKDESHQMIEPDMTFVSKEVLVYIEEVEGEVEENIEYHNMDTYDACNKSAIDEHLAYYNWLADSAMTLHVTHE
jgi:hypothetical protein